MNERIIGLVPSVKKPKSFGRWDTYTVVITESRTIFAQMTSDMLKQAAAEAQRKGKEEGKGFLARWGDQLKASMSFSQRYWDVSPDDALRETPGNFALSNADIRTIRVEKKAPHGNDDEATTTELVFEVGGRKLSYSLDGYSRDLSDMLQGAFGDRVKTR